MQKNNKPLVSVVIATYTSRRTIEKCLQSIQQQTYSQIEIIVVDAQNYDKEEQKKCEAIIKKYARLYKDGPERSIQRNRGIKEAKGDYILLLDQDMYLTENLIEECVGTMNGSNHIALVIPEISIGEGFWTKCVALERYISTFLEEGMNECCRFFRKKDAAAMGGYDVTIVGVEDSDFHYRMKQRGSIGKTTSFIYHDEGRTQFFSRVKKKYYYSRAFRKYLKRYPAIATGQFFPIKKAYFIHWKLLAREPITTLGIIALRGAEVLAGGLGMIFNNEK